jgi:hypothetical protein
LYLETTLRCLSEISDNYFCATGYPYGAWKATQQFNKLISSDPWDYALEIKYFKKLSARNRIKLLLVKLGIWLPLYFLKKQLQ